MNLQFAIKENQVYVLEVNPRASRTVPFVAKATGVPVAKIATRVMTGEKLRHIDLKPTRGTTHVSVKEALFPFARFPDVDVILGPEMKSTGEVMGINSDFSRAFAKSQLAAGNLLPNGGTVFISIKNRDKEAASLLGGRLSEMAFSLMATSGTSRLLASEGLAVRRVNKVLEGRSHCVEAIISGKVYLINNTT
jgi:carbamoyl-phosphate synthase large subunit